MTHVSSVLQPAHVRSSSYEYTTTYNPHNLQSTIYNQQFGCINWASAFYIWVDAHISMWSPAMVLQHQIICLCSYQFVLTASRPFCETPCYRKLPRTFLVSHQFRSFTPSHLSPDKEFHHIPTQGIPHFQLVSWVLFSIYGTSNTSTLIK
jgi:hypothetical protein